MKTDTIKRLHDAFRKAIADAGSMNQLSLKTGVSQCSINRYNSGKQDLANIPFSSLLKLFPKLEVIFFPTNSRTSYPEIDASDQSDRSDLSEESDNGVCQDALTRALQKAEAKKTEYEHKVEELARAKADLENARKYLELEKENIETARNLLEQEKENWRLKRELEEAKNDVTARLFKR